MGTTGFKWYLGIQTGMLEITWFILLWWGIQTGNGGIWFAWFILTCLSILSSAFFAASILGSFDHYKDQAQLRLQKWEREL